MELKIVFILINNLNKKTCTGIHACFLLNFQQNHIICFQKYENNFFQKLKFLNVFLSTGLQRIFFLKRRCAMQQNWARHTNPN